MKDRPELESKFEERVQEAIKYASTIEDFDKLVNPRTLARHCLGPEPSYYVLRALKREEKKSKLSRFGKWIVFSFFRLIFVFSFRRDDD